MYMMKTFKKHSFQMVNGILKKNQILLSVDWFPPFKHLNSFSVG